MSAEFNSWLKESTAGRNLLACGLRYPDKTCFSHAYEASFTPAHLEVVLRGVGESFQLLKQQKQTFGRVRWMFEKSQLHCAMRGDGICLSVFTSKSEEPSADVLDRLFAEFQAFRA
jgi:hypothetical protein